MENNETGLEKVTDTVESMITGVPAPIRKNVIKSVGQLCTAALDIPIAWLEGIAAEKRATNDVRVKLIQKQGENISEQIEVPDAYIKAAGLKFVEKIVKEQKNLDKITKIAVAELTNNEETGNSEIEAEDISEDWLNEFENLARLKSSEEMQLLFGKILSGEIVKPGSFSIRTIKLISQLDNESAKLFQILCSQTVLLLVRNIIQDARVVCFRELAGGNGLKEFGLSYDNLSILQEYGFITADVDSIEEYTDCIEKEENQIDAILGFQNNKFKLVRLDKEKNKEKLELTGVALTKAGKELLTVVPIKSADTYKSALIEFFKTKHFELVEIKKNE